jgi:hypothetical protein
VEQVAVQTALHLVAESLEQAVVAQVLKVQLLQLLVLPIQVAVVAVAQ